MTTTSKPSETRRIRLSQGKYALVDERDYHALSRHKWCADKSLTTWYAVGRIDGRKCAMQNFLLRPTVGMVVDHINRNGLDNRRTNLRICTQRENQYNRRGALGGTSIYKGVSWAASKNKWYAGIKKDGKAFNLGYFDNEKDAAIAYNVAAQLLFGEYAYINDV